jgi:hypothetical protein
MYEDHNQREHRRRPAVYGVGLVLASLLAFTADLALTRTPPASSAHVLAAPQPHPSVAATDSAPATPRADTPPASQRISGTVLDADRRTPLPGASVWAGQLEAVTDAEGRFALEIPGGATLIVKAPGYELRRVPAVGLHVAVALKPKSIRAAYLTYYGIADPSIRSRVLELVDRTELNAVVIDVKGDRGLIPYRTDEPTALAPGALRAVTKGLRRHAPVVRGRIYTIARIVAFKDNVLAKHRPDLAIIVPARQAVDRQRGSSPGSTRSGEEVWTTSSPSRREVVAKGFTRSVDYVRLPTDAGCPRRLRAAEYVGHPPPPLRASG